MPPAHDSTPTRLLLAGLLVALIGLTLEPTWAQDDDQGSETQVIPTLGIGGNADSNGRMIAVTGVDVTGQSILYLVDTENRALSVYQATGGTPSMMSLRWVGARNIDLDLRVDGFNDQSEFKYKQLAEMFGEADGGANTSLPGED